MMNGKMNTQACSANHEGSAGKMEVDSIVEMFNKSETLYNVRYSNYVGETLSYKGIVDSNPYEDLVVKKKNTHTKKHGYAFT